MPPASSSARGSSTCTSISASPASPRRKPSPPAPGPRQPGDSPPWSACRTRRRRRTTRAPSPGSRNTPRARRCVNVFPTGGITKGLAGEELAPIGSMHGAGIVALTDDGHCVQNHEVMRRALEYARMFGLPDARPLPGLQPRRAGRDARGLLEFRARPAGLARRGRGNDRDAQHPARGALRRADPLPAPQLRGQRPPPARSARPRRAASPARSARTTSRSPTNPSAASTRISR